MGVDSALTLFQMKPFDTQTHTSTTQHRPRQAHSCSVPLSLTRTAGARSSQVSTEPGPSTSTVWRLWSCPLHSWHVASRLQLLPNLPDRTNMQKGLKRDEDFFLLHLSRNREDGHLLVEGGENQGNDGWRNLLSLISFSSAPGRNVSHLSSHISRRTSNVSRPCESVTVRGWRTIDL